MAGVPQIVTTKKAPLLTAPEVNTDGALELETDGSVKPIFATVDAVKKALAPLGSEVTAGRGQITETDAKTGKETVFPAVVIQFPLEMSQEAFLEFTKDNGAFDQPIIDANKSTGDERKDIQYKPIPDERQLYIKADQLTPERLAALKDAAAKIKAGMDPIMEPARVTGYAKTELDKVLGDRAYVSTDKEGNKKEVSITVSDKDDPQKLADAIKKATGIEPTVKDKTITIDTSKLSVAKIDAMVAAKAELIATLPKTRAERRQEEADVERLQREERETKEREAKLKSEQISAGMTATIRASVANLPPELAEEAIAVNNRLGTQGFREKAPEGMTEVTGEERTAIFKKAGLEEDPNLKIFVKKTSKDITVDVGGTPTAAKQETADYMIARDSNGIKGFGYASEAILREQKITSASDGKVLSDTLIVASRTRERDTRRLRIDMQVDGKPVSREIVRQLPPLDAEPGSTLANTPENMTVTTTQNGTSSVVKYDADDLQKAGQTGTATLKEGKLPSPSVTVKKQPDPKRTDAPPPADIPADLKRNFELSKKVSDAIGITALLDKPEDYYKYVKVTEKGISIELPDSVLNKLNDAQRKDLYERINTDMKKEFVAATGNISTEASEMILTDSNQRSLVILGSKDDIEKAVDKFVAAQKGKPKTLVGAAIEEVQRKKTNQDLADELAKASGIKDKFGDKAKVSITDEGIKVVFDKDAMKAFPPDAQEGAQKALAEALAKRFPTAKKETKTHHTSIRLPRPQIKPLGVKVEPGTDGTTVATIPLTNTTEESVRKAVTNFKGMASSRNIIPEALEVAKDNQDKKYLTMVTKAAGAAGASIIITKEITKEDSSRKVAANLKLKPGQTSEMVLGKAAAIFKKKFKVDILSEGDKDIGSGEKKKVVKVDLEAIAKYDRDNGAGAFERDLNEIQAELNKEMNITPTPDAPAADKKAEEKKTPEGTKPPGPFDFLDKNKGMGIGGIIGIVIGFLTGNPLIGGIAALLLGGLGAAFVDGKDGVLGIDMDAATNGNGPKPKISMTPALQKSVTAYATARFTNAEGVVDTKKVEAFVARYDSMVAKNMSPADQDARALEIKVKILEADYKSANNGDMLKAMGEAKEALKINDAELIKLAEGTAPGSVPMNVKGVKAAVQSL